MDKLKIPSWIGAAALVIGAGFVSFGIYDNREVELWPPKIHPKLKPALAKVSISGNWKYKCTVIGGPFHEWGGTAKITQETTPFGVQWRLSGQRLWETTTNASGKKTTTQLQTPYPWESNWGVITSEPGVRYGYRIATADGEIEGYAYGDIITSEGQADTIVGKFYELPPVKPQHGKMEFRRMINSSDTGW